MESVIAQGRSCLRSVQRQHDPNLEQETKGHGCSEGTLVWQLPSRCLLATRAEATACRDDPANAKQLGLVFRARRWCDG